MRLYHRLYGNDKLKQEVTSMSYTVHITVNLPDDLEVTLNPVEVTYYAGLFRPIASAMDQYPWTSLVITIARSDPPKATKTFVD